MTVALEEIADVIRGVTFAKADATDKPGDGLLPVLRAGNISDELDVENNLVFVDQSKVSPKQVLRKSDIVVCTSSGSASVLGKSAILRSDWNGSFGAFLATVRPDPGRADPAYVSHFLRSPTFRRWASGSSGIGIKNIRASELRTFPIPLPPLDKQKRIAAILDQADALCRLRQRAIDRLNTLGQAIFHEMFGDPSRNPMGWTMGTIRDLLIEAKYGTSKKANTQGEGIPVLRMGNITYDGALDLSDLKYVELSEKELPKYTAKYGDILFNRTNSKELVGKTAVYDRAETMALAGYLVRARVNERGNPFYISAYMNSAHGKKTLRNMCKSIVGMANINAQEFQNIAIAIPPVQLQDEFENRIVRIGDKRKLFEIAQKKNSELFASLQSKAFIGEL